MHGLSIIIPTYNEKENLKILIPKIYSIIKVKKFEILIVENDISNSIILLKKNTINSKDWTYSVTKINECIFIPFFLVSTLSKRSNGDLGSIV